ncbi:ABC transporter ATP-binding protein [Fimbriimonas ginsengisoli]|uniref:Multidrug resistance ABC transporter ATP-binding and permease protein n=1 Tax=Fimbriimonas ginsengisoli Gsoil 348 TaxID=661478 RepID=A0A068NJG3_FIMGI|nr:ABC transporter ATP-binding protein [Fimbriimonas ginsengisoli]AIE83758.1 Multidrug resistance ABC transporter ATP-binding and permease protein [Fimbriimonas ginsengisoli Gsoil 348]
MSSRQAADPRELTSDAASEPSFSLRETWELIGRFWRFVRPYRSKFILGIALLLFAVPLGQFALFLTRDVTNRALLATNLTADERWGTVLRIVALQTAFWLASAILSTWREVLEWYCSMRSTFDLRLAFYRHLHRLPLSFLSRRSPGEHLFRATGDMVSMFRVAGRAPVPTASGQAPQDSKEVAIATYSNDVDPYDPGMMGLITRTTPMIVETIYALAWGVALLFLIDPVLSALLVAYIVPFTLFSRRAFDRIRLTAFSVKARTEYESGVLRDSIAGLRTLKAFGRLGYQRSKYQSAATATRRRGIQQAFQMVFAQNVLQMGMKWAFSALIYTYLAWRVMTGRATIGDWVATFLLVESAQAPLENLVQLLQLVKMQLVPGKRILETLDEKATLEDRPGAPKMGVMRGEIRFQNVHFSYEEGRPALRGVDLVVHPGEFVGIVGPSGAGKSSLVSLLLRLHAADSGYVRVDGHDVREVQLQGLLDQVGTVPQLTYLYSGTIADNVLFGNPWATDDDVALALELSGVMEFAAKFPDSVDTEIGEGGSLSGGERQRIGIARALVRRPKILILDEATASLDPRTEDAVLRSIDGLREKMTILSIAHRLKAVVGCDRIVVMHEGRIVQVGTHRELVEADGLYRNLWIEQSREAAVGGRA